MLHRGKSITIGTVQLLLVNVKLSILLIKPILTFFRILSILRSVVATLTTVTRPALFAEHLPAQARRENTNFHLKPAHNVAMPQSPLSSSPPLFITILCGCLWGWRGGGWFRPVGQPLRPKTEVINSPHTSAAPSHAAPHFIVGEGGGTF